jgi:hypothetical protein
MRASFFSDSVPSRSVVVVARSLRVLAIARLIPR